MPECVERLYVSFTRRAILVRVQSQVPNNLGVTMSKSQDVLHRAYGNIAKDVTPIFDINFLPTYRGFKYYWYRLIRKIIR